MQDFTKAQQAFTDAVRHPDKAHFASTDEARRMQIYQSLLFNNVNTFLENGFPVLRSVVSDEVWQRAVQCFFAGHDCTTPYFSQISHEFLIYLSGQPEVLSALPPFTLELAHYEWLELDVSIRQHEHPAFVWSEAGLPEQLICSPLAELVSYQYPVHLIGPDYLPEAASPTPLYYVVWRNSDFDVKFLQVNDTTAFLIQNLARAQSPEALLNTMFAAMPQLPQNTVTAGFEQTLHQLLTRQIVWAVA
ncbi:HvfC family RiPP maturation protein [Salinimonas lutimaris]|uniref:HvfC family RiPP maturation protein n=1 Tax=Salinimonas lutimaris TaxID=914153 RepID=UPI0010C04ADB|nr:putative DNA-binding domain-containing protein [Salinimonas lutimaris]